MLLPKSANIPMTKTATMLAVQGSSTTGAYVAVGSALVGAMLVVYLVLRFAGQVRRLLRESGTMLLTRIAGLLLSAIAVQLIANAVRAFIAGEG